MSKFEKYLMENKGSSAKRLIDDLFTTQFFFKKGSVDYEKGVFYITTIDDHGYLTIGRKI